MTRSILSPDEPMDPRQFVPICKRYISDHLVIRAEVLKMGGTADTPQAVFAYADRIVAAVEFGASSARRPTPSKSPKSVPKKATPKKAPSTAKTAQWNRTGGQKHQELRHRIAQVLAKPLPAAKIAERLGIKDVQTVHRCLSAEKGKWFRHSAKNKTWHRGNLANRWIRAHKGGSKAKAKANTSNAAEGRRAVARGDRPPMKEAMATVIGDQQMGAAEVVEGLQKRGWMPNANDPQQYISYMLSSNRDVFVRVERGFYRVKKGVAFPKRPVKKASAVPASNAKPNGAAETSAPA